MGTRQTSMAILKADKHGQFLIVESSMKMKIISSWAVVYQIEFCLNCAIGGV